MKPNNKYLAFNLFFTRKPRILIFTIYLLVFLILLVNVVQLLCSLSGWLHLNRSSIGTGFRSRNQLQNCTQFSYPADEQ